MIYLLPLCVLYLLALSIYDNRTNVIRVVIGCILAILLIIGQVAVH